MARSVDITALARAAQSIRAASRDANKLVDRATATLMRRIVPETRRDIQAEYNLPARRILPFLSARRGDGYVELTGSKRGIGLVQFGGRYGGRKTEGAVAQVRKAELAHFYGGTFIANLRGGNRQIVARFGPKRLPLRTLYGPSIAQMLRNEPRRARLARYMQSVATAEIDRLLQQTKD